MTIQNNVPNDNITSYDSGDKVFQHDKERGKWSSNWDFFTACIGNCFTVMNLSLLPRIVIAQGAGLFIIFYLLGSLVFTIPIIFIQSFLGQFSSTGFISAFRIAPMFKGIGYVILCLNLFTSCYRSVFTALPLLYLFTSFVPNMPWMSCSNSWNSVDCTEGTKNYSIYTRYTRNSVSSADEYYAHVIELKGHSDFSISWRLLLTTMFIWMILGAIMTTRVKTIGQILRYITFTMSIILLLLFIRILCLPTSFGSVLDFLVPLRSRFNIFFIFTLFISALSFGSGWGTVLTLASYNDFKINVGKMSVLICLSHLVVILMSALIHFMIENYIRSIYAYQLSHRRNNIDIEYVYIMFPFLFGKLEAPQIWSILYFLMLFLGEFSSCVSRTGSFGIHIGSLIINIAFQIIQVLSIFTAIFDEFVKFRIYKNHIKLGLILCLVLFSILYTFRDGINLITRLNNLSGTSQMLICFIELMIVVWIYGRLRFQRDIKFMTGIQYSTWKFFVIRLITPIFVLVAGILYFANLILNVFMFQQTVPWIALSLLLQVIPLIVIPIYIVIRIAATTGTFLNRFRRLCKPNDWYPVDPVHRQKYEEYLGNPDITHQLVDMDEMEIDDNNMEV